MTALYNVPIMGPNNSGPGTIQVDATDAASAVENAHQGGNTPTGDPVCVSGCGGPSTSSAPSSPSAPSTADTAAAAAKVKAAADAAAAAKNPTAQMTAWIKANPMLAVGGGLIAAILLTGKR